MLLCNVRCVNPRVTGGKRTIIMNWILNPSSLSKRRLLRMNWPTNTVPVLFLMPRRGTEPTTIARWSLIPEGESRFCQKAAAKATRPDHRHASLPRRICTIPTTAGHSRYIVGRYVCVADCGRYKSVTTMTMVRVVLSP